MELPYTITVEKQGNLYFANVKELDIIEKSRNTHNEAYQNMMMSIRYNIKTALESGEEIPKP